MSYYDDMHYCNVAKVLGIPVEEVTKEQRAAAKRVCFGAGSEEDALRQLELFFHMAQLVKRHHMVARSPYADGSTLEEAWVLWPRWWECEIGDHIEIWQVQRDAIGGYEYRFDEHGEKVRTLINLDARPNLTATTLSPYAMTEGD